MDGNTEWAAATQDGAAAPSVRPPRRLGKHGTGLPASSARGWGRAAAPLPAAVGQDTGKSRKSVPASNAAFHRSQQCKVTFVLKTHFKFSLFSSKSLIFGEGTKINSY